MKITRQTIAFAFTLIGATLTLAAPGDAPHRPEGPCDIYAAAGKPCDAAHSTTRALYAAYNGPLYQVLRQSDGKTLDIGVVKPTTAPAPDPGGYANAAAQDAFCANTYCFIAIVYDQSGKHNDLTQAPRGGFSGPAMGGFNNLPIADMAPVTVMGHKVYGVFIEPGMGLRQNDAHGTAVDDQAEGQYWVINGRHFNNGCCFDYGNAEIDSRDDDNGTMETTYYGDATAWYHGNTPGPWIMTDQENNLVGCVNKDAMKLCDSLPNISWQFVTAMGKGEPHHWTTLGGDAQKGKLAVMFDGPRINSTYDPMRKQGAILLGNGGDNSNASQGTFYEGAMTAANTFPSDATDQLVQANVVAARYAGPHVSLAPTTGVQTFAPGSSQQTTVTFTNTSATPATNVQLSIAPPAKQWTAVAAGNVTTVAPGGTASVTFKITSGAATFNGDLVATARWRANGRAESETTVEKVRNVSPVSINEFRIASGSSVSNSFIELYNGGGAAADLSGWSLTIRPTQLPVFSSVRIPAGTSVAGHGFYLLGLSNSGLAAATHVGDATIHVRSAAGMAAGDTVIVGDGADAETHKIVSVGTAATSGTTLWQPVPEGPVITIPVGATTVPVTSVAGFEVGQKIALGHGAIYPDVARAVERYEVATVTAVGKPGTQALLAADAPAGTSRLSVTSVANITAGDKIRLDIDSLGHGVETVTVTKVDGQATRSALAGNVSAGATGIRLRTLNGFAVGDQLTVGTPANRETVTITSLAAADATANITPALAKAHGIGEAVINPGTGLELATPLKFNHAANLPFGDRGTGISFSPATAFAHSSNEPVQPLGTGITLDAPLAKDHAINSVVRDAAVTTAGYQGSPAPNQWFGGPALSSGAGSMVLRDAANLVVDSLNYGHLVDPWAAQGYQATSGTGQNGCRVIAPVAGGGAPRAAVVADATDRSAGRFPDGHGVNSNCADFVTQSVTTVSTATAAGATNIKVAGVAEFNIGETLLIDTGANLETATIATVGTPGASTLSATTRIGVNIIPVASGVGFVAGQSIVIGSGAQQETAVVASVTGGGGRGPNPTIAITTSLTLAHDAGSPVAGSGITLTAALKRAHAAGVPVTDNVPTPGAPNRYAGK